MDVSYINPFLIAIVDVFKIQFNEDLEIGPLRLKDARKNGFSISGVIGLSGTARGFVVISYPKSLAVKIVSRFLGAELDEFSPYVADGIGELTNMVAGNAQKHFPNFRLSLSLPHIVFGANHRIEGLSGVPVIVVPLTCEWGEFEMEISFVASQENSCM
jgi:chemotaxis protein CheX